MAEAVAGPVAERVVAGAVVEPVAEPVAEHAAVADAAWAWSDAQAAAEDAEAAGDGRRISAGGSLFVSKRLVSEKIIGSVLGPHFGMLGVETLPGTDCGNPADIVIRAFPQKRQ